MSIFIDPVTRQRIVYDRRSGDIVYDLVNSDSAIVNETVPVIGPWSDHTGSANNVSTKMQMYGTNANELQGEDAGILGEKLPPLNEVGDRAHTTRRRQIKRRVEFKNGKARIMNNGRTNNERVGQ